VKYVEKLFRNYTDIVVVDVCKLISSVNCIELIMTNGIISNWIDLNCSCSLAHPLNILQVLPSRVLLVFQASHLILILIKKNVTMLSIAYVTF